jgi:hypothetical protein
MSDENEKVSHLRIYEELIVVRTKLDSFMTGQSAKDEADKNRDARIDSLSARVYIGLGICMTLTLLGPLIVTAAAPRLHFGQQVDAQDERRP